MDLLKSKEDKKVLNSIYNNIPLNDTYIIEQEY